LVVEELPCFVEAVACAMFPKEGRLEAKPDLVCHDLKCGSPLFPKKLDLLQTNKTDQKKTRQPALLHPRPSLPNVLSTIILVKESLWDKVAHLSAVAVIPLVHEIRLLPR
jgi:hypothetical protein